MKLVVFAVKDLAVGQFMQPGFAQHIGAAVREFKDACNSAESPFGKHPEDYELWKLDEFDSASGLFHGGCESDSDLDLVLRGKDCVNRSM